MPIARWSRVLVRSLAASLALTTALAGPSSAFDVQRHLLMTRDVLGSLSVPVPVVFALEFGVMNPDLSGWAMGYCEPAIFPPCLPGEQPSPTEIANRYSMQHFDNNRIWPAPGGIDWVNFLITDARGRVAAYDGSAASNARGYYGLLEVGFAMHAVQDFYAHSNYAEFNDRLFTRVDQIPMWEGLDLGGSTTIPPRSGSGLDLEGIQTGYFLLPTPGGGTTHDILNKDNPGTPEGAAIWQNILFQNRASYYQVVSGQTNSNPSYTAGGGLAPRHTAKTWQAFVNGTAVYNFWPPEAAMLGTQQVLDLTPQLTAMANDTNFAAITREVSRLKGWFAGDMNAYPSEAFDTTYVPRRFSETVNDVWVDFSAVANPAGPWSYGWTDDGGVTFHANEVHAVSPGNLATWSSASGGGSRVAASPVDSVSHEGGTNISGGSMSLLPGAAGSSAVVRYTAPAPGTYQATARFWGQSGYLGTPVTTSDVRVLVNGALAFADSINVGGNGTAASWSGGLSLAAGDHLDFVVRDGGNGPANDATGLHVFVVPSAVTSVDDGPRAPSIALAPIAPNPSAGPVRVRFTLPRAAWATALVLDLAGREVIRFADGPFEAGTHSVEWNGRSDDGALVPPGVYHVRLASGREFRDQRLVIVR